MKPAGSNEPGTVKKEEFFFLSTGILRKLDPGICRVEAQGQSAPSGTRTITVFRHRKGKEANLLGAPVKEIVSDAPPCIQSVSFHIICRLKVLIQCTVKQGI